MGVRSGNHIIDELKTCHVMSSYKKTKNAYIEQALTNRCVPDMASIRTKSIMVVDDELDIVNLIKQSLDMSGFKVRTFMDALAALKHFKSNFRYYDIVISDIRMPAMNGYEFIKHVKKINRKVKTVLMSAFEINDKEFHNLLPDIKIDAFIQKPFSIQQLKHTIDKISIRAS